ncbi:MAG: outer membrane beta-barrel protein [Bacteroidota bacterium]
MRLCILLLLLSFSLQAQRAGGWIGGDLQLNLFERTSTTEDQVGENRQSSFSLSMRPYWLKQSSESSAWGLALLLGFNSSQNSANGNENQTKSYSIGPGIFWRFRVFQAENSGLQLGLEPGFSTILSLGSRPQNNNARDVNRTFSLNGLISPYLFFPFSERFRGLIRARGFGISYSFFRSNRAETNRTTLSDLEVNLNPATWTFGLEWNISGK